VLSLVLTIPAVGGNTLSTSGLGRFLVFVYIWLPFMILPVQAALERCRLIASGLCRSGRSSAPDLPLRGAAAGDSRHCRRVDFTFSLTLGDFIVPQLVGPPGFFIGNMVYSQQGRSAICRWRRRLPWCRSC
jgi:putative spermidine/putrescine transport system permease protein